MQLISNKTLELVNALELSEGEVTENINTMLIELSKSADQSGMFLDRSDAVIAHLKSLTDQIKSKISVIEASQDFVKAELKKSIALLDSDLEGDIYKFKLSKAAPKVVIDDELLLDQGYMRTKTIVEIDKKAIGEDLKKGYMVNGAHLEDNYSLRKSINTNKINGVK